MMIAALQLVGQLITTIVVGGVLIQLGLFVQNILAPDFGPSARYYVSLCNKIFLRVNTNSLILCLLGICLHNFSLGAWGATWLLAGFLGTFGFVSVVILLHMLKVSDSPFLDY